MVDGFERGVTISFRGFVRVMKDMGVIEEYYSSMNYWRGI